MFEPIPQIEWSQQTFAEICKRGHVLTSKRGIPSIIQHVGIQGDMLITKVWQKRQTISTDWLYPYQQRFCVNAKRLRSRGVVAPDVQSAGIITGTGNRWATYTKLEGISLREAVTVSLEDSVKLMHYLVWLHNKGIYFRTLHLGNVLRLNSGSFGLIDVTDVYFRPWSLPAHQRARNLSTLLAYPKDVKRISRDNGDDLLSVYMEAWKPKRNFHCAVQWLRKRRMREE